MTMVQEFQKKKKKIEEKSRVLESAIKLPDARDDIIDLFRKRTFPYKGNVFKTKEEESEEESGGNKLEKIKDDYKKMSNILRMNQRALTMTCLKIILVFQYLVLW